MNDVAFGAKSPVERPSKHNERRSPLNTHDRSSSTRMLLIFLNKHVISPTIFFVCLLCGQLLIRLRTIRANKTPEILIAIKVCFHVLSEANNPLVSCSKD